MPRGKPNALKRAIIAEEQKQIFEAVLKGTSVTAAGEAVGVGRDTAYRRFRAACDEHPVMAIENYRTLELARLDRIVDRLTEILDASDAKNVVNAAQVLVRVQERRAKLLGMDAAIKVEQTLTVRNESSIDEEIRELSEMLGLNDPSSNPGNRTVSSTGTQTGTQVSEQSAPPVGVSEQPSEITEQTGSTDVR